MEKPRFTALLAMAFVGVQLSGCASIIKGSTAAINVTTPPVTGANCTLSSSQGNWQLVSPASVTVERSKEDIQVRCIKEGYQDASAVIPSNFEGWTVGNLVFGGLIGVGVDAATGALNDYPNAFQIPMYKLDPSLSTPVTVPNSSPSKSNNPKPKPGT